MGATHFFEFLCDGQIRPSPTGPLFCKTVFGWIAAGSIVEHDQFKTSTSNAFFITTNEEPILENVLQRFWQIEDMGDTAPYTNEERTCQEYFNSTVTRNKDGRFIVHLPFRNDVVKLGKSYKIAKHRLFAMERKFQKDKKLKEAYCAFMKQYELLNHMERVEEDGEEKTEQVCYLPHHAIRNDSSTKFRVVFDASCKTDTGISLNDVLLKGPVIQDELLFIVARFRTHNYVLTADIAKMCRQILMNDKHRDYQRILWRNDSNTNIQVYRLNTVTYGTVPASYLATGCLQLLAETTRENYPHITSIMNCDFYMDDLLTGAATVEEVIKIRDDLITVMNSAGLTLRKWSSNNANLITSGMLSEDIEISTKYEVDNSLKKILGLFWNAKTDNLQFKIKNDYGIIQSKTIPTKRDILSDIAQIFDPLGLIGPVIICAKIILQMVWQERGEWDEPVSNNIQSEWLMYNKTKLSTLNELIIPRKITTTEKCVDMEIHGFADASEKAYGACLYLRTTDTLGKIEVSLLCAKSKVAPLKTLSLPRLELCAALLLVRLANNLIPKLQLKISQRHFWTDSKITLAWIASPSAKWKTFVAHRVSEIQDKTSATEWRYVNTRDNPADVISRGCDSDKLITHTLWWSGPGWLAQDKPFWPEYVRTDYEIKEIPEGKENSVLSAVCMSEQDDYILNKYESFTKCIRVTAYCLRFINNVHKNNIKLTDLLKPEELERATKKLIKITQYIGFRDELRDLSRSKSVSSQSKLFRLRPFLDDNGVIRVSGRIKNASTIDIFQRHSVVLPANCAVKNICV